MAAGAILDLDHPQIGVAVDCPGDIGVRFRLRDRLALEGRKPAERTVSAARLAENPTTEIELVQLQQHAAAGSLAAMDHRNWDSLDAEPAQMRLQPDMRRQSAIGHDFAGG